MVSADEAQRQFDALDGMIERFRGDAGVRKRWEAVANEVFDAQSLIFAGDRDPLDVLLRRSEALLRHIESMAGAPDLSEEARRLEMLKGMSERMSLDRKEGRYALFEAALLWRRRIAFSNPLLNFDKILFVKRHFLSSEMTRGNH
ncbi:MAG: hypothetical protein ACYS8Z_11160, partial [Planctomycetota bacterium]